LLAGSSCKDGDKLAGLYHNHPSGPGLSGTRVRGRSTDVGVSENLGVPIGATGRIGNRIVTDTYTPFDPNNPRATRTGRHIHNDEQ